LEKLIYPFWLAGESPERARDRFIVDAVPRIRTLGATGLQISVADLTDLSGTLPNFAIASTRPRPDGIVSFWLTSAWRRDPVERLLREAFPRVAGYVVAESTILPDAGRQLAPGDRSPGFSQVTFLQVPPRLDKAAWRRIWFEEHTPVAIDTQANFRYVQNVVVMPLAADCPPFDGIVEESFPTEALRDPAAFFGAHGDPDELKRRMKLMRQSSARFIDLDRLDVIATSEYLLDPVAGPSL
jgi:hypothetical protein